MFANVRANSATWGTSQKIPLGTPVVRALPDPQRPWVYAIDRANSRVLFVNLASGSVERSIYVGKDPSDCDIDATGNFLYVANKGPGTGLPGSWRIGVIALTNQTLVTSYITAAVAENVVAGRTGRLYYNSGFINFNGGDAHSVDTDTGADLGTFAIVKTAMVISSDKTRLFGQYTYEGNLGAMGAFEVSTDQIALRDTAYYSPYPYGWDYVNYSLSGDNQRVAHGYILFNATNFADQIGLFPEQIYALNHDATIAFGASIWDTTTFPVHGDATRIASLPFATTIMSFHDTAGILYSFNPTDLTLYAIEQKTLNGILFSWLKQFGLPTSDSVEAGDNDGDGYTNLQEWILDSDPTKASPGLSLELGRNFTIRVDGTSPRRTYELQISTDVKPSNWQLVQQSQGSSGSTFFDVSNGNDRASIAFYRVLAKL